jgi:dolichol-phosphate mannosyltransferase
MFRAAPDPAPAYSIVIPVYDEAENVAPLLEEIGRSLAGRDDYEIVVIDDGSTDATPSELARIRAAGKLPLRVLRHRRNAGKSAALLTGAQASRAEWVVTMDGDCQNDPADIDRLFRALAEHQGALPRLELVCGHRRVRRDAWLRRVSSRVANAVRARLLNDGVPDTACGLKLVRRETFLALPAFVNMHRFLPALVQRAGGAVISVEVNHRPRVRGEAKYGLHNRLWVGIADLLGMMWLARRPLVREIDDSDEAG